MTTRPQKNFVDVDAFQREHTLEEAAAKCGVQLDVTDSGKNVRIDCPFNCKGDHASKREIAIDTTNDAKQWRCHAYGCECRGNLLNLMHGWLTGTKWSGDKLRGQEFRAVADAIKGEQPATHLPKAPQPREALPSKPRQRNLPLKASENEASRALMNPPLWEKLTTSVAAMPPAASAYVRRHTSLSPEAMAKWNVGIMPTDGGGDKRGWSLRNHIVYPFKAEDNEVIAFVGRDPSYEEKLKAFEAQPPEERDASKRPIKHRFPKGFQRGIELFGQQKERLNEARCREAIAKFGLIVVEGFNDVIRLDSEGIPAVAICSNIITDEQIEKLARWAKMLKCDVSLMFDCDDKGDAGVADAAWKLLQAGLAVRAVWGRGMHGGKFRDQQPEALTTTELEVTLSNCQR